jgi:hypothetical protein
VVVALEPSALPLLLLSVSKVVLVVPLQPVTCSLSVLPARQAGVTVHLRTQEMVVTASWVVADAVRGLLRVARASQEELAATTVEAGLVLLPLPLVLPSQEVTVLLV